MKKLAEETGRIATFDFCDIGTFDMSDPAAYAKYDWGLYGTVINCGVFASLKMNTLLCSI